MPTPKAQTPRAQSGIRSLFAVEHLQTELALPGERGWWGGLNSLKYLVQSDVYNPSVQKKQELSKHLNVL